MNAEQMKNYRDMVRELLDVESGLTGREIEFLDSLNEWEGNFSVGQVGWLDRIYTRIFGE